MSGSKDRSINVFLLFSLLSFFCLSTSLRITMTGYINVYPFNFYFLKDVEEYSEKEFCSVIFRL